MKSNPTGSIDNSRLNGRIQAELHNLIYESTGIEISSTIAEHSKDYANYIESLIQDARIDEVRKHQLDTWGTTAAECSEYMSARLKELS